MALVICAVFLIDLIRRRLRAWIARDVAIAELIAVASGNQRTGAKKQLLLICRQHDPRRQGGIRHQVFLFHQPKLNLNRSTHEVAQPMLGQIVQLDPPLQHPDAIFGSDALCVELRTVRRLLIAEMLHALSVAPGIDVLAKCQ